jgi:3-oxoadipate enol-lactonase
MTEGLLLIHAFPLDARMWDAQRRGDRTVAVDLPGFGGATPAPDGVLTMSVAAETCVRAIDDAGLDRVVVCGLSMGGYVAFELWRTARERVAGLVLANTKAEADTEEGAAGRRALAERLGREGNVLIDAPPPLLSEGASDGLRAQVRGWIADQPAASIAAAALGMAVRPDSTPDLAGIDVPTLVITSDADTLIPAAVTSTIAGAVPGGRLVTLEGAGHLSNLERPEAFTAALDEHVERCGVRL